MNEMILLKLGELVLKGLNRRSFEDKLQANIHRRLHPFGQFRVYTRQSTTYVEPKDENCDVEGAYEALQKVFGIVGLSLARPCEKASSAINGMGMGLATMPAPESFWMTSCAPPAPSRWRPSGPTKPSP